MKKETLGYGILIFLTILMLYYLSKQEVFSPFLLFFTLLLSFFIGYFVSSNRAYRKSKVDETLTHIVREILHELNIPLSTIKANTTLLKRKLEDEKSLKRIERIEDASLRLARLYDELNYGIRKEIEAIEYEKVDIKQLIEERVEIMQLLNRNCFNVNLEPLTLFIDKIGFEKMLDNLLTNAMKYSSKEKNIDIYLDNFVLTIQDYGIGMDEVELLSIYERYFTLNSSKGEGIGLALVKAYCDEANIGIDIFSKKGQGTIINLNLKEIIV